MKKYIYLFLASIAIITFSSCEEDATKALDTSFASFVSSSMDIGVEAGSQTSAEVKIYTTNITGSDRTIPVMVVAESTSADAGAYTVPSTVTIPGGSNVGTLTIDVKDVGLSEDKMLVIRLESTDDISTGETLAIGLSQLCPNSGVKLAVNISFDSYPEENAWRILDADGNTVLSSVDPFAYGAYGGLTGSLTIKECLPSGTYTIEIYDQYGDGGTGFSILANGILVYSAAGADYTDFIEGTFSI